MNILGIAGLFGLGLIMTIVVVIIAIIMLQGGNNVTFLVIKTFNRSEQPVVYRGKVRGLKDKNSLMSEAFIRRGSKFEGIGSFHQQFIQPFGNKKYLMILEEWDVGRYRPLVRLEGYGLVQVYEVIKDAEGKAKIGVDGKPEYKPYAVKAGVFEAVSNDDFDYTRHKLDEITRRYAIEEKRSKLWQYLAGAALAIIVVIGISMSAYFNYQTTVELKNGAVAQTQAISETIYKLFSNETIREAARVAPPKDKIPAPPG